ncbi:MAG: T9SS type A sorting domain-containing protein [Saprospiraceae bacterium]|nr:T9SS type A sorting domain-containing protein [Saprospiraceae bacterium]
MSYNENQAIDAGNLVTFVMKATTSGQLSEMLSMGSEVTQAEAYVGSNLEVVDIDLRDNTKGEFVLYQNEPNPFTEYTMISFEMPQGGSATLSLFDVTGKVLKVVKANYAAGYNSVKVTREDLGAAGMVYYKLETEDNTATKHMVVIK